MQISLDMSAVSIFVFLSFEFVLPICYMEETHSFYSYSGWNFILNNVAVILDWISLKKCNYSSLDT